jgi:hypothetical protein
MLKQAQLLRDISAAPLTQISISIATMFVGYNAALAATQETKMMGYCQKKAVANGASAAVYELEHRIEAHNLLPTNAYRAGCVAILCRTIARKPRRGTARKVKAGSAA